MPSARANINPELLIWARKQAVCDPEDVAKYAGIKAVGNYLKIEAGERLPTIKQLWKIADKLNRSPAFFYLNEPPPDPEPLRDFRRLPGIVAGTMSPQLARQIQRAREEKWTPFFGQVVKWKLCG